MTELRFSRDAVALIEDPTRLIKWRSDNGAEMNPWRVFGGYHVVHPDLGILGIVRRAYKGTMETFWVWEAESPDHVFTACSYPARAPFLRRADAVRDLISTTIDLGWIE